MNKIFEQLKEIIEISGTTNSSECLRIYKIAKEINKKLIDEIDNIVDGVRDDACR